MDDWFEDEDDEREDMHLENMCVEPGCLSDGSHGSCGLCGGPLCFRHEEVLAGFCTGCSESPDFSERMHALYHEVSQEIDTRPTTPIESAVNFYDEEIPF